MYGAHVYGRITDVK